MTRETIKNIEITDRDAEVLEKWLDANSKVPGWLDGYALGGSYIDIRAAKGSKKDGRKAYVDLDHATAEALPVFRGVTASDIRSFLSEREQSLGLDTPAKVGFAATEVAYGVRVYDRAGRILSEQLKSNNRLDPDAEAIDPSDTNALDKISLLAHAMHYAKMEGDKHGLRASAMFDDKQLHAALEEAYSLTASPKL